MKRLFAVPALGIIFSVMVCCTSGNCFSKAEATCSLPITER